MRKSIMYTQTTKKEQKIPSEMEVAPRYTLLSLHCLHHLHCWNFLHCWYCSNHSVKMMKKRMRIMTMMRTMKMIMMMMMMMLMMRKSRFALMEVQRGFLRRVSIGFCPRAISKRDKFAKYCQKLGQQKCPQDGFATRVVLCLLSPKTCRLKM